MEKVRLYCPGLCISTYHTYHTYHKWSIHVPKVYHICTTYVQQLHHLCAICPYVYRMFHKRTNLHMYQKCTNLHVDRRCTTYVSQTYHKWTTGVLQVHNIVVQPMDHSLIHVCHMCTTEVVVCSLGFHVLTTCMVISGWRPTCDDDTWRYNSAAQLGDQVAGTISRDSARIGESREYFETNC